MSAITAPTDKTLFEFARLCGMRQERQAIQLIIEHYLNASDPVGRHEES